MIKHVYAIFDAAAGHYMDPFVLVSHGLALRDFQKLAGNTETMINQHAKDFSLFHIGEYDTLTSRTESINAVCLQTALQARSEAQEENTAQGNLALEPGNIATSADLKEIFNRGENGHETA